MVLRRKKYGRSTVAAERFGSRVTLGAILLLGTSVLSGCSRNTSPAVGAEAQRSSEDVQIFIQNQNFYDAAVFIQFQGGSRRRLATVQAYTTERRSVRYDPGEMWFFVDFVGARRESRSRVLSVSPGETVRLELTANAHLTGQIITRQGR